MQQLSRDFRATWALALPLIGGNLAQQAIGVTDTLMLGWYGVEELAAIGLAAMAYFLVHIVGVGFALAVMPMVAAAATEGDDRQVRRVTRMGLWLSVGLSLLALPFFWFSGDILILLGQEPELAALSQRYLRIAGFAMSFSVMSMVLKNHLAALEHAQIALWSTLAAAGLNLVLNWLLIFGNLGFPELGIEGAACATLGTSILMFLILALYAAKVEGVRQYDLFSRLWRPDWPGMARVFKLGLPIGATHLAESAFFAAAQIMMGWIGVLELAAHGVAIQIASITFMAHVGLSSAATVRAGKAWARRDPPGLKRAAIASLSLSAAVVALTIIAFLALPAPMIGLFLDPDEPQREAIIAIGIGLLAMAALFQLADASQAMALGLLRGLQDTAVPMVIALLSYWLIGVPAMYALGFILDWQGIGIWLGLVIGLIPVAALLMWRFRGKLRAL